MSNKNSVKKAILLELKDIIEGMKYFNNVDFGRVKNLSEVDIFPSCSIFEDEERMEFHRQTMTSKVDGYDRYLTVSLHISLDMEDPLEYANVQAEIEKAVLVDSKLWKVTNILDRDVVFAFWDRNDGFVESAYKKQGIIQFTFRYRNVCE
jgi:hypothetical protein